MPTTAIVSTQILDSGLTGRELVQAADQAAAQAAIGFNPSDYGLIDSDNTWTGVNTWTGFNTFQDDLTTAFIGATGIDTTGSVNIGEDLEVQGSIIGNSATFSGTVTAGYLSSDDSVYPDPVKIRLDGTKGYLYGFNSIVALDWTHAAVRVHQPLSPVISDTVSCGTDAVRWSDVYSVDGNFSGTVKIGNFGFNASGTNLYLEYNGADTIRYKVGNEFCLEGSAYYAIGASSNTPDVKLHRDDANVLALRNGSSGQSFRVYNYGDPTTDSEYLETSWDTNVATIANRTTGAGAQRDLVIQAGMTNGELALKGARVALYDGGNRMLNVDSSSVQIFGLFRPSHDNTRDSGSTTYRWRNTYSVDGNFSGTLNATIINDPTNTFVGLRVNGSEKFTVAASFVHVPGRTSSRPTTIKLS